MYSVSPQQIMLTPSQRAISPQQIMVQYGSPQGAGSPEQAIKMQHVSSQRNVKPEHLMTHHDSSQGGVSPEQIIGQHDNSQMALQSPMLADNPRNGNNVSS